MKHRLYLRLFFSTAAIVLAGLLLFAGTAAFVLSSRQEEERVHTLRNEAMAIANALQQVEPNVDYSDEIKRLLSAFSNVNDASVFFVNRSGLVSVCSDTLNRRSCPHDGIALNSETVYAVFTKGHYESTGDFGGVYDTPYYTVGVPILGSESWYENAVFVSAPVYGKAVYFAEIVQSCAIPFGVSLILIYLVVFWLSRKLLRPIREISDATKAMANGDFSHRVSVSGKDEIAQLAMHFNSMAESLGALDSMSGNFVTNVSHDLKTPMTTIAGFVDGILDGTIPPREQKHYLALVSNETKRLSNTVNTMLSLSRIQSGMIEMTFAPVDLTDVLCRVVFSFEHAIEQKGLGILGLDELVPCQLDGDESLLYQAIYNLVDNAVKFVQPQGYISFSVQENNSDCELYIKNSGDGIPADDLQHVFERFYKLDKSRSMDKNGSGVGLYIVKTIIDHHGGQIDLRSTQGQYTQFCVRLPKSHK